MSPAPIGIVLGSGLGSLSSHIEHAKIAVSGRNHFYEGLDPSMPIENLAALGVRTLILTNAAGGIRPDLTPGAFMLITDHLDLTARPPLVGHAAPRYDEELSRHMREAATAERIPLAEGVYAAMLGPSYETAAEIRMLRTLGADAVGMSTVPETIVAASLGMRVVAVSCITNHATGTSPETLSHEEVLNVTAQVAPRFERLIRRFVERL